MTYKDFLKEFMEDGRLGIRLKRVPNKGEFLVWRKSIIRGVFGCKGTFFNIHDIEGGRNEKGCH